MVVDSTGLVRMLDPVKDISVEISTREYYDTVYIYCTHLNNQIATYPCCSLIQH